MHQRTGVIPSGAKRIRRISLVLELQREMPRQGRHDALLHYLCRSQWPAFLTKLSPGGPEAFCRGLKPAAKSLRPFGTSRGWWEMRVRLGSAASRWRLAGTRSPPAPPPSDSPTALSTPSSARAMRKAECPLIRHQPRGATDATGGHSAFRAPAEAPPPAAMTARLTTPSLARAMRKAECPPIRRQPRDATDATGGHSAFRAPAEAPPPAAMTTRLTTPSCARAMRKAECPPIRRQPRDATDATPL